MAITPPPLSPTRQLEIIERRQRIIALWAASVTYAEIAKQLKVSLATVRADIHLTKKAYRKQATDVIDRSAYQLDQWDRNCALAYDQAKEPSEKRAWLELRLAIFDRRCRLLGLNAPSRMDLRLSAMSNEEFAAYMEDVLPEMREMLQLAPAGEVIDAETVEADDIE
jgi:hypothetical protein